MTLAPGSTLAKPEIGAVVPYFGGKRNLAPEIVAEVGPHRSWWELCCGSLAVTLAKPKAAMETVVDKHGHVHNLVEVVKNPTLGPKLYRRLRREVMDDRLFADARATLSVIQPSDAPLLHAHAYFVVSWMGRNGMAGTRDSNTTYSARYTHNGGHAAKRFAAAVDSIPAWRRRLREVTFLGKDVFEVAPKIEDDEGVGVFADPPYIEEGDRYLHAFSAEDHARFAEEMGRFRKARVVLTYYDHPRLRELYPPLEDGGRWTHRRIEVSKSLASAGSRGETDVRATEVLVMNGPSRVEGPGLFCAGATGSGAV